jgi:hypothetical protein
MLPKGVWKFGLCAAWCSCPLLAAAAGAAAASGTAADPAWMNMGVDAVEPRAVSTVAHEAVASFSFIGGSDLHRGGDSLGDLGETYAGLSYVAGIPLGQAWQLRAGFAYERYDFGSLRGGLLPNTLGAAALVIGADVNLSDQWILRVEARPGVYGDFRDLTGDQCNVPVIVGATYLVNADLQWFFGLQFDPHFGTGIYHWDDSPVMPGLGARWHFADQWTLLAVLPDPELQYDLLDNLQLYVGARLRGGNYRTGDGFGRSAGRGDLGGAHLSYREIRLALGARYRFMPGLTLEAEGGSAAIRQFYYSGPDLQLRADPAGYLQIQLRAQF